MDVVDRLPRPGGPAVTGRSRGLTDILLVEDNPADARLTIEALQETRAASTLHLARDGEEALAFLRREDPHRQAPRPAMVLLDLNLPRKNGREVLEELKRDPELGTIPVVVLTTSTARADILRAYQLHANSYVVKPLDLDEFLSAIRSINGFWLGTSQLP
jgi:two-component system, chemotaxis family, response regulator Rcp1